MTGKNLSDQDIIDLTEEEFIFWAMKDNKDAAHFVSQMAYISHFWDDLIDKDKPISDKEINMAFRVMLLGIGANRFYQVNVDYIMPILAGTFINFETANKIELEDNIKKDDSLLEISWYLRDAGGILMATCASLIAGPEWAEKVNYFTVIRHHDETVKDYIINIRRRKEKVS